MTSVSDSERELPSTEAVPEENPEGSSPRAAPLDEPIPGAEAAQDDVAQTTAGGEDDEQTGRTTLPAVATVDGAAETEREPGRDTRVAPDDAAGLSEDAESSDDSDLMLEDDAAEAIASTLV